MQIKSYAVLSLIALALALAITQPVNAELDDFIRGYQLENSSWIDESPTQANLTMTGTVLSVTGKIGNASQTPGTVANYLSNLNDSDLPTGFNTTELSISAWIRPATTGSTGLTTCLTPSAGVAAQIAGVNDAGAYKEGIVICIRDNTIAATTVNYVSSPTGYRYEAQSNITLVAGVWYHVVATFNLTTLTVYVNASNNGSNSTPISYPGTFNRPLTIGVMAAGGSIQAPFNGLVDAVYVWDRALNITDIQSLYNNGTGTQNPFSTPYNVYAQEIGINTSISGFTLTFNGSTNRTVYVSGTNNTVILNDGDHTVRFNKTGYFNITNLQSFIEANNNFVYNFDNASRYAFQIKALNSFTNLNDTSFTVSVTSGTVSYSQTVSTTNGTAVVYWFNDTNVNLTILSADSVSIGSSVLWNTSNYTTTPMLVNVSIPGRTANVTTIYIYDETNGTLITNNVSLQFSGPIGANLTLNNGSANITLIAGTYKITYSATGYSQREYSYTVTTSSSQTIILFLLSSSLSTTVRFTVSDTTNFRLTNATVYIQKRNSSGTNYYLVATCTTDTNGQCVSNLNIIDTTYRFLVYYLGLFRANSLDTVVTSTEVPITVSLIGDPLDEYFALPNVATDLTYTNGNATWTVADGSGNVQQGCVRIYRRTGFITTELASACGTGAAFTVSVYANNSLGDENYAIGTIYINGQQYQVDRISEDNNDLAGAANTGLVLLAVVFAVGITLAFKYSWDMTTAVVMFMTTTTLFWSVGLIQFSSFALISGLILLSVFLMRNNQ